MQICAQLYISYHLYIVYDFNGLFNFPHGNESLQDGFILKFVWEVIVITPFSLVSPSGAVKSNSKQVSNRTHVFLQWIMMDLPCVQWQDHVAQKWIGLDPEIKEQFTSQLKIDDVFKRALTLIT